MANTSSANEIDLDFLHDCLREGGQLALSRRWQATATIKPDQTPVTEVDKMVESLLIERIHARYPGHRILSEESGAYPGGDEYTWVLDPIDGTRAFATGLPIWGVSIGVLRGDEPLAGGFYLPVTGELFSGTRQLSGMRQQPGLGQSALYNGQPIPPVERVDMVNPLYFLAVSSHFHLYFTTTYPRVRSLGSTAAQLCYVATGAAVGALHIEFSLWDIAGVLPLLYASGVELYTLDGQIYHPGQLLSGSKAQGAVLAARPSAVEAVLQQIIPLKESPARPD